MSIVYLGEELPEIELREYITQSDYVDYGNNKKGINVHSFQEILDQVVLLISVLKGKIPIPINQKALAIARLHKELVADNIFPIPTNIIPLVNIERKDNNDEQEFFNRYEESHKLGNYHTRIDALHKTFLGFKSTSTEPPILNVLHPMKVNIDDGQSTVLLPKDNISPNVQKLNTKIGISPFSPYFYELTLADKIKSVETEGTDIEVDKNTSIEETFKREIPKKVHSIIQDISISTLYDLSKKFMEEGINIDEIHFDDFQNIYEKIIDIKKDDTDTIVPLQQIEGASDDIKSVQLDIYSIFGFYSVQREIYEKNATVLNIIKTTMTKLYKKLIGEPISKPTDINANEVASLLLKGERTLEEIKAQILVRLNSEQRSIIDSWYSMLDEWSADNILASLDTELKLVADTLSLKNEPNNEWSSINEEIQKIKRGEVISKEYDPRDTFHVHRDFMLDIDDPDDIPFGFHDEEETDIDMSTLNEGLKEIYTVVSKMFIELQKTSSLELDFDELTIIAKQANIIRKTKASTIDEVFPDISEESRTMLYDMNLEIFNQIDTSVLKEKQNIGKRFEKIYNDYINDITSLWIYLLAWWICEMQDKALQNRLHFDTMSCPAICRELLEPLNGVPIQRRPEKNTGLHPYLVCIINMLINVDGSDWKIYVPQNYDIDKHLKKIYSENQTFIEKIQYLQDMYASYKKPVVSTEKGRDLVNDINNTINKKKTEDYLKIYMLFLKNLPAVLSDSKHPNRSSGCCLQSITPRYKANADYSNIRNAIKLNKYFSKKRKLAGERPLLRTIGQFPSQEQRSTLISIKPPLPKRYAFNIANIFEKIIDFNPSLINIDTIIRETEIHSNVLIKMFKQHKDVITFISETTNPRPLIDCIRKLTQLQNLNMLTNYANKEKEHAFLKKQFEKVFFMYDILLNDSHDIMSERDKLSYLRILQYFCIYQLYFPFVMSKQPVVLTCIDNNLEASFLKNFTTNTMTQIHQWIITKTFNKSVNYSEYITKMREQENISKLKIIDMLTEEERHLYVQAKKLGILEGMQYMEAPDIQKDFVEENIEIDDNNIAVNPQENEDEFDNENAIDYED